MTGVIVLILIMTGFFYILAGFAVKKNPGLIAGYDKLGEYQRKTFPGVLRKGLTVAGIITIAGCSVSVLFKWNTGILSFSILPVMIVLIIILLKSKRTQNKKLTKS